MSNKVKDIDIKNHRYYFFVDINSFFIQIILKKMKSHIKVIFTILDM